MSPQAIGFLIIEAVVSATGLSAFGGTVTILGMSAATAAAVIGTTIVLGATIGIQLALQSDSDKPMENPEITIRQPLPGRFIPVGRIKVGGAVFAQIRSAALTTGALPVSVLTLIIGRIISCAPIESVDQIFFNNVIEALDGAPNNQVPRKVTSGPYRQGVTVEVGFGRFDQVASPLLLSHPDSGFTTAHRGLGLAYIITRAAQGSTIANHTAMYPNGAPSVACVIRGVRLPDPRLGQDLNNEASWTYSDNAALAVLRFMIDRDGWGLAPADLDIASFNVAATDCDTMGYHCAGIYSSTDERRQTLDDLLAACDGRLIEQPDGRAKLIVGINREPILTINTSQILETHLERFGDVMDRVDGVKARIIIETNNWQETEVDTVFADGIDPTQAPKILDLPIKFCPDVTQARRLAKAKMRSLNPAYRGTIITTLAGLQVYGERIVRIVFEPLGINRIFEVTSFGLTADMTVSMSIVSVEADNWTL